MYTQVLDAMFVYNRTLAAWRTVGLQIVPGMCHPPQKWPAVAANNTCADDSAELTGDFGLGKPRQLGGGGMRVASPSTNVPSLQNPMPTRLDVQTCVERCRRCGRCVAVSVSSARGECLWYSRACHVDQHALISRYQGQPFDDFVTVQVRTVGTHGHAFALPQLR